MKTKFVIDEDRNIIKVICKYVYMYTFSLRLFFYVDIFILPILQF